MLEVSDLIVAYVNDTRVTLTGRDRSGLVNAGFFTRNSSGTYHLGSDTKSVFTQQQIDGRVRFMGLKKVTTEITLKNAQKVWTNKDGEFYIAKSRDDLDRVRIL